MVYLALVACVLVTVVVRLAGPRLGEKIDKKMAPPVVPRPAAPQSLEGALAAQLANRVITCEQYRRAMEFVAATDTESF